MAFWHDLVTQKSFAILQDLKKRHNFILIGGWAVFLYTHALKSKDIDMILDYAELENFKRQYDLIKNDRLKKYEAKVGEIDIDIYVPHFSNPGMPAEEIAGYTTSREGFKVPIPEVLLILKERAYLERQNSIKGEKDRIDIISILQTGELDLKLYWEVLKKYKMEEFKEQLLALLKSVREVPELNLDEQKYSKLKKGVLAELSAD